MRVFALLLAGAILLGGCALSEDPVLTPPPPLTIMPGPTPILAGACELTRDLNEWLQASTFYAAEFGARLNAMSNQGRGTIYAYVQELAEMRNALSAVPAPDCTHTLHQLLLTTMDRAISTYQAFANGEVEQIGGTLSEVIGQLDRVAAGHAELTARLQAQFEAERRGGS